MGQLVSAEGFHTASTLFLFSKDQHTERDNREAGSLCYILYTVNNISLTSWSQTVNHKLANIPDLSRLKEPCEWVLSYLVKFADTLYN